MKKKLITLLILIQLPYLLSSQQSDQKASNIIEKIDNNMFSKTQIVTSEMIIYGKTESYFFNQSQQLRHRTSRSLYYRCSGNI